MHIDDMIRKSMDGNPFSKEELVWMLERPSTSPESFRIMGEAHRISKELTQGTAEIHAQFALNLGPCRCNCAFCSFAEANRVFERESRITPEEAVIQAKHFESEGANAIFLMITATYPLDFFFEIAREVKRNLEPETILVANVGDQSLKNSMKIKDAGFSGVYHAVRLREGTDTGLSPSRRKESLRNFQEAGLRIGTCVEPIGPEHTNEEIAEMILFTGDIHPAYSGAARRISIPGTTMAEKGMINELRLAQMVAVTRLGVPRTVKGNCTHEPFTLGAVAGANLFWAEAGANPRDTAEKTEEGRGESVGSCRSLFHEAGWGTWKGSSRFYGEDEITLRARA
jgi:biotin synthase